METGQHEVLATELVGNEYNSDQIGADDCSEI